MTEKGLSRREILKAMVPIGAGLGLLAGGGLLQWLTGRGERVAVEQVKGLKKEQDPQRLLQGMMDLGNRYIAEVINDSRLDQELNVAGLIEFGGGEKTLQAARVQLDRPEISQAIDRSLPRDFWIMQIDCQPDLRKRGLEIAKHLVSKEIVGGIKSARIDSIKMEGAGALRTKEDGSTVFVVALNQNGAINSQEQKYVDYALVSVKPGKSGEEKPLLTLEDFATRGNAEKLQWSDGANQQAWESRSANLNTPIEARFNPNPLLQI